MNTTAASMCILNEGDVVQELLLGQQFTSFQPFKKSLREYELLHKQKYTISSSRTIKSANVNYSINPELVYYEVVYGCIHRGGFRPSGKGIRNSRTLRMNCPATIKLRASKCGKMLILREIAEMHTGHDLSTKVVDHLVHNRKLDRNEVEDIQRSIELGADKKQIQNMFLSDGVKKPTLKDIRNIAHSIKYNNEVDNIVHILENIYNCNVSVLCSEDNIFKALYFSTPSMRNSMQAWPEFISIDGTYKLINNGSTVFLLLVEDSDGHSEIVGICIAADEDKNTLSFFLTCFKNENLSVENKIQCFMGDKDLLEREVLKEIFPGIPTYLCLFHTLKTFKREITTEKMNISKKERELSLEYLQKLVYSSSSVDYDLTLEQFKKASPKSVLEYFEKNWNGIKEEWTVFSMHNNFLNTTNNRMESLNNKIKQVVGKNSNMSEFIRNIFVFLYSQRHERDHHAANHILKRQVSRFEHNSPEEQYEMYLTRFAFQYVLKQIQLAKYIKIMSNNETIFLVKSKNIILKVTFNKCQCRHFSSMLLPCKHIFLVRKHLQLPLFARELCNSRWTRQYYLEKHNVSVDSIVNSKQIEGNGPTIFQKNKNKTLSVPQKRKKILTITNSIATLGSLSCNSIFEYRFKLLQEIESAWRQGKEVTIENIDIESSIEEEESGDLLSEEGNTEHNERTDESIISHIPSLDLNLKRVVEEDMITLEIVNLCDPEPLRDDITIEDERREVVTNHTNESESSTHTLESTNIVNDLQANVSESCQNDIEVDQFYIEKKDTSVYDHLLTIKMPDVIKKRGRPRGADLTVIGLKKKRKCSTPKPFCEKNHIAKVEIILKWILLQNEEYFLITILNREYLVSREDLELNPENINDAILDDSLDFGIIKNYLDEDGFIGLLNMLSSKKKMKTSWNCTSCQKQLQTECIRCDSCLQWFHFYCVGLMRMPKTSTWFCNECYS